MELIAEVDEYKGRDVLKAVYDEDKRYVLYQILPRVCS